MFPYERSLVKQLADKPYAHIGVNTDKDLEKIRGICEKKNITWRSFWNGPTGTNGPISRKWNVSGYPTIYLIDAEGIIRYKGLRGEKLFDAVETLLAEIDVEVELEYVAEPDDEDE